MRAVKRKDIETLLGNCSLVFFSSLSSHLPMMYGDGSLIESFREVHFPETFEVELLENSIHYYSDDVKFLSMEYDEEGFYMIYCFWKVFLARKEEFTNEKE